MAESVSVLEQYSGMFAAVEQPKSKSMLEVHGDFMHKTCYTTDANKVLVLERKPKDKELESLRGQYGKWRIDGVLKADDMGMWSGALSIGFPQVVLRHKDGSEELLQDPLKFGTIEVGVFRDVIKGDAGRGRIELAIPGKPVITQFITIKALPRVDVLLGRAQVRVKWLYRALSEDYNKRTLEAQAKRALEVAKVDQLGLFDKS